jgi:hypothetical protein
MMGAKTVACCAYVFDSVLLGTQPASLVRIGGPLVVRRRGQGLGRGRKRTAQRARPCR